MVKKKCLGGLKLLLLPLFIMLLGMCSTCYANVSTDYITYLLESARDYGQFSSNDTTRKQLINDFIEHNHIPDLVDKLNQSLSSNNWQNINDYNLIMALRSYGNGAYLIFNFSNCTFPNGVNDIGYVNQGSSNLSPYQGNNLYVKLNITSADNFSYVVTFTSSTNESFDKTEPVINGDTIKYTNIFNYSPTQVIYRYYGGYNSYLLTDSRGSYINNIPEPEEPSGEESGDTPSDSGDSGGNVGGTIDYTNKLNDINNNISNSANNIIQNSNENTDKIINSISGETNKIINNITNTDTDLSVSGELSNMLNSTNNVVDPTVNFFSWLLDNLRSILNDTRQL